LSGGERNRLLLAKLFCQPANLLILDEPTNDLDYETLEVLEGVLSEFQGTILLVSHDREFINNVATSVLAFEGDAKLQLYAGGYDDFLSQRKETNSQTRTGDAPSEAKPLKREKNRQKVKLSYKEERELEALPERIESLEGQQSELHETLAAPETYQDPELDVAALQAQLEKVEAELDEAMERWETLETLKAELSG